MHQWISMFEPPAISVPLCFIKEVIDASGELGPIWM